MQEKMVQVGQTKQRDNVEILRNAEKAFGRLLQREMSRKGMTFAKMAELCEVDEKTPNKWGNGNTLPPKDKLAIIAKALGVIKKEALETLEQEWKISQEARGTFVGTRNNPAPRRFNPAKEYSHKNLPLTDGKKSLHMKTYN